MDETLADRAPFSRRDAASFCSSCHVFSAASFCFIPGTWLVLLQIDRRLVGQLLTASRENLHVMQDPTPGLAISSVSQVWLWIHRLGGPGLVLLGLVDNSVIPVPGSMDVFVVLLSAHHPEWWAYYGLMA